MFYVRCAFPGPSSEIRCVFFYLRCVFPGLSSFPMVIDITMRGARPLRRLKRPPVFAPHVGCPQKAQKAPGPAWRGQARPAWPSWASAAWPSCACLPRSGGALGWHSGPRSQEGARRKSAWHACPMADLTNANSCLNPKAQPASPPHAEAQPLGESDSHAVPEALRRAAPSQRLGHAVPLRALR